MDLMSKSNELMRLNNFLLTTVHLIQIVPALTESITFNWWIGDTGAIWTNVAPGKAVCNKHIAVL